MRQNNSAPIRTDEAVVRAAVGLARALRGLGMCASVDTEHLFLRALTHVNMSNRDEVFWAARSAFVHNPDEREVFDAIFERFWAGQSLSLSERGSEHGESDARMGGSHHGGEALPQYGGKARDAVPLDGAGIKANKDVTNADSGDGGNQHKQLGLLSAWSAMETLSEEEVLKYQQDEMLALRELAEEIKRSMPLRRSRRSRPAVAGHRLDVRRTLRRSLATEGEAFRLSFTAPTPRPRRLLFVCDVSGSMERYSRVLLASLKAAIGAARKAEAFVFATRLTRLTKSLDGHDFERALEKARAAVPDWSGGTRIGGALREFNDTFARRGFARGAIVIVVSDGWDRGDPASLAGEVQRLQLQARRLVWINPRPMSVDDQPLAIGMRAAIPFIDEFVPGHDPRAVAGLAQLIAGLGHGRPQRQACAPASLPALPDLPGLQPG